MMVKSYRCFRAVLISVFLSSCFVPSSLAGHVHCKIDPWSLEISDTATKKESGIVMIPTPTGWTADSSAGCNYELSDITSLEVTFTFTNTAKLTTSGYRVDLDPGSGFGTSAGLLSNLNADIVFMSGVSNTMLFAPHTSDNGYFGGPPVTHLGIVLEFDFGLVSQFTLQPDKSLFGDGRDWTMTEAVYKLHGNHYYIPIPAPLTLISFVLLFRLLQRLRKPESVTFAVQTAAKSLTYMGRESRLPGNRAQVFPVATAP